jgi:hypothetical protein
MLKNVFRRFKNPFLQKKFIILFGGLTTSLFLFKSKFNFKSEETKTEEAEDFYDTKKIFYEFTEKEKKDLKIKLYQYEVCPYCRYTYFFKK